MPDTWSFACPRCRMAFSSRPLLREHQKTLCLGIQAAGSSCTPGGDLPEAEKVRGTAERLQDTPVEVSQQNHARPHHLLLLPRLPPAVRGQQEQGQGRARGAPLGDVLTPFERALLRPPDPAAMSPMTEQEEPSQRPAPQQRHGQLSQELLEAHKHQMAEIRARTQKLEQEREGLCQQLEALRTRTPVKSHPEQGQLKLKQDPEVLQGHVSQLVHARAALHLDTLLPPMGPLTAEARALQLSYLRAGGHDPTILDQLLQLQVEAMALENKTSGLCRDKRTAKPSDTGAQGLDAALLAVELENRQLEDELLALKVRREKRANAGSQVAQQHQEELAQLQAEVRMLRSHTEQMGPQLPPAILPPPIGPPVPPALAAPELFMESLEPALWTGSLGAPSCLHVSPSLTFSPFALKDPPPTRDPLA